MRVQYTVRKTKRPTSRGRMTTERDLLVYTEDGEYYVQTDIPYGTEDRLLDEFDPSSPEWERVEPSKGTHSDGSPRSIQRSDIDRSGWNERIIGEPSRSRRDDSDQSTEEVELVDLKEEEIWGGSQTCFQPVVETESGQRYRYTGEMQMNPETARDKVDEFDPEGRKWERVD